MQLPIPDDWTEQDGYTMAFVCVPNSVQWRATFRGAIYGLTRGRGWDETTGAIPDVQIVAKEIYESMCMANCDDLLVQLTRIGDALESSDGHLETISTSFGTATLQEVIDELEDLDQDLLDNVVDVIEVLRFLGDILPNLNIDIPISELIGSIATWRFRQSMVQLTEDIALSQRAQSTALMGTDGHGIYDLFDDAADTLLLPAGVLGKAIWLWNRVKPSQIPWWTTWINWIIGQLYGNIRSALYDRNTIAQEELNVQDSIDDVLGGSYDP